MSRVSSVLALLALAGCGNHSLRVVLDADSSCQYSAPVNGFVSWQLIADGARVCGDDCMPTAMALNDLAAVSGFLRARATPCSGLRPGQSVRVRVVTWQVCQMSSQACGESDPQTIPDGRQDDQLNVMLKCSTAACNGT